MRATNSFCKIDSLGLMSIDMNELFDIDGGRLHTTKVKESDGSLTVIYTDSKGNVLSVQNWSAPSKSGC